MSSTEPQVSTPIRLEQPGQPPVRAPRKRRKGCCLGRLLLVLALIVGVVLFVNWWTHRTSDALVLGKRARISSDAITHSGGTLTVDDPTSPIDGLSIDVPDGAYEDDAPFRISTRPIESHTFGADFDPITPLIHVDNGGEFAADAMTVRVPIDIATDEFAMGFFYDEKTGALEGIPLLDLTTGKATLLTAHFSDFLISKVSYSDLMAAAVDAEVDTGFRPGVDDWQFVNRGSYLAQGGHCAGQSLTAMWYYYEQYLGAGERRLYGRYDNNDYGYGTIDFQEDDSWGYRWASVAQRTGWNKGAAVYRMWGLTSDTLTWWSFAYALKLTDEPQYVSIGRYVDEDGKEVRKGHALIAYRIEGNRLYVADPNYPGQADRYISFENSAFLPYASGENAIDIAANGVRVYPEIHYIAKTALIDWNKLGTDYAKLLKGESGEGYFPAYTFSYVSAIDPTTGSYTWLPLPEMLELDADAMAQATTEAYRGKLIVGINMMPKANTVTRYDGIQAVWPAKGSDGTTYTQFIVPLHTGVNDLGFLIENTETLDGKDYYNDFRRVKVIYEMPDLSGTWEGTWQIGEALNAQVYIEDGLVWVLETTGIAEDEAEAREIAVSAIEVNPNLYDERPMIIVLEALDPDKLDRYSARVYPVGDDGTPAQYVGEATYSGGTFTLKTEQSSDGTKFNFTGTLEGTDALSGEFNATAWWVLKNAMTGYWKLDRQQ